METFTQLHERLAKCYNKINYKQYYFLSDEEKDEFCAKERASLADHLNSDAMNFENIVKQRISFLQGTENKFII